MKLFNKIFIPIVSSIIFVSIFIGYRTYHDTSTIVHDDIDNQLQMQKDKNRQLAREKLSGIIHSTDLSSKLLVEESSILASLDFVKEAYRSALTGNIDDANDTTVTAARNRLKEQFRSIADNYKLNSGKDRMSAHFHLLNNRSFARTWRHGWQRKENGVKVDVSDDLSGFRSMVVDINKNKRSLAGIELGVGGFVIRGIAPIKDENNRHLGSIETYTSFNNLIKSISLPETMNITLVMPSSQLDIAKSLNDPAKFPIIDNKWVPVCCSTTGILSKLYDSREFDNAFSNSQYEFSTPEFEIYTQQITDYSGKAIGMLVLSQDLFAWNNFIAQTRLDGEKKVRTELASIIGIQSCVLLLLGGIAFYLARYISRSVAHIVNMLKGLEKGDLDHRVEVTGKDEIATLGHEINNFADNLRDEVITAFNRLAEGDLTFEAHGLIKEPLHKANSSLSEVMRLVQEGSAQIASSSMEIADSSVTLAEGATKQASSMEEISASLGSMSSQTSQNALNTKQVKLLINDTSDLATTGNQQMEEMIKAMTEMNVASENIAKIIKVIDEIAFQTNLLALNAAVEAARAGHHGKGFAVVAEEVRNLAGRSAKAASETEELIRSSVDKTHKGSAIATDTAESLKQMLGSIEQVQTYIADIAESSQEQASGIKQINTGLDLLDEVTQSNTAGAETSAAVAEQLSSQAEQMRQMLQKFKVEVTAKPLATPKTNGYLQAS